MDNKKLFVGNLPWSMSNHSLQELFAQFGEIAEVVIISDRDTGRSRGFGFVTFTKEEDAKKAMEAMHEKDIEGRKLVVNIAKQREDKPGFKGNSNYQRPR